MDAIEYIIYTLLFLVLIAFIGVIAYIIYDNYTYKNNLTTDLNTNFIDINQNFNSTSNIIGNLHEKHSSNIGILRERITDTNTVLSNNVIDINSRYNTSSNLFNSTVADINSRYNTSSNQFKSTVIDINSRNSSSNIQYTSNADNFSYNLNKFFAFKNNNEAFNDTNKKIYEYRTFDEHVSKLELIAKTTAISGLQLNTAVDKELGICNSGGTKCFKVLSTDDSLSIYKPLTQEGNKDIFIGGNDATAPLKIVGGKVFINGAEYIPPLPATAATAAKIPAVAVAKLSPASISNTITVVTNGSGYTSIPGVVFNGALPPLDGTLPTATAVLGTAANVGVGKIASITVNTQGSGYTIAPIITFNGGGGTGASATTTLVPTSILNNIDVSSGGSGYTGIPTVVFSGGMPATGVTLPTATAVMGTGANADKVASITVNTRGSGYTVAPSISFTGGGH